MRKTGNGVLVAIGLAVAASAGARSLEDASAAYGRHDYAAALAQYQRLADSGDPLAQRALGAMFSRGEGVPKDDARAASWYRKSAQQANADAQADLGDSYCLGLGVSRDETVASTWYRKAAEQGLARAQFNLGVMVAEGRGVPKDEAQALAWFRKAAQQGNADAQVNLGAAYQNGIGAAKDAAVAASWYEKAAQQGDPMAQHDLARLLLVGNGVQKDEPRAAILMRQSAEQGLSYAQSDLGLMYAQGRGTPQDPERAYFWWLLAAEQGDVHAIRNRDRVEAMLGTDQREKVRSSVRDWKTRGAQRASLNSTPPAAGPDRRDGVLLQDSPLRDCVGKTAEYPKAALRDEAQGTNLLKFEVAADGRASTPSLDRSAGHPALDAAALEHVSRCLRLHTGTGAEQRLPAGTYVLPMAWKLVQ